MLTNQFLNCVTDKLQIKLLWWGTDSGVGSLSYSKQLVITDGKWLLMNIKAHMLSVQTNIHFAHCVCVCARPSIRVCACVSFWPCKWIYSAQRCGFSADTISPPVLNTFPSSSFSTFSSWPPTPPSLPQPFLRSSSCFPPYFRGSPISFFPCLFLLRGPFVCGELLTREVLSLPYGEHETWSAKWLDQLSDPMGQ